MARPNGMYEEMPVAGLPVDEEPMIHDQYPGMNPNEMPYG